MDIGRSHAGSKFTPKRKITNRQSKRVGRRGPRRVRNVQLAQASASSAYSTLNTINSTIAFQEIFPIDASEGAFLLPFSPTKWLGTRTARLLQTYGSYRPLRVTLSYQPISAATTGGAVAIGTVFNGNRVDLGSDATANITAIASLANAFVTQVYGKSRLNVRLGTALSRNNYPTTQIDEDDIPFWIVCSSTVTAPGFLTVAGVLSIHNPMNVSASSVGGSFSGNVIVDENNSYVQTGTEVPGIAVGDTIKLAASKELKSAAGAVIYRILEPIVATVTSIAGGITKFMVNSNLGPMNDVRFVPIGAWSSANF